MGSLYISSILGSHSYVPDNLEELVEGLEDSDDFWESDELAELEKLAKPFGCSFEYRSTEEGDIFTFGKRTNIGIRGIYSGWFGSLDNFITEKKFPKKEDMDKIKEQLQSFLNSLPEKYLWIKSLNWSEIDLFLNVTS